MDVDAPADVEASAPGKLFLLGEYGVARGGPAVVAALERRVGCRLRSCRGTGRLRIRVGAEQWSGPLEAPGVDDLPGACRFVASAARVAAHATDLREIDLEIETWSDLDGPRSKVGLGGSAAVVAAVVAAVYEAAGRSGVSSRERAGVGVAAHRLAQGGGSGADVVAATLGGVLWIAGLDASTPAESVAVAAAGVDFEAEAVALPEGLRMEIVATDQAARTGPRIRRFVERASAPDSPARASVDAWCAGMGAAADALRDACGDADAARALDAVRAGGRLLGRLGALTGIRVFTPALREACSALGGRSDVAIKPSGAGGGDCAVALVGAGRAREVRDEWVARGLRPLAIPIGRDGARARPMREGRHG